MDQFWSNQEILYNFEASLKTGTGILKLLTDNKEDMIIEESQESCDQNHLNLRFPCEALYTNAATSLIIDVVNALEKKIQSSLFSSVFSLI